MIKLISKNQKGITLISLVITIIVLLILAGAAILMLSGENGILKKSEKASFVSDIGKYKEELELYKYEFAIEDKTNKQNPLENIKGQTYWEYDEIKKYIPSFDKKYEGKIGIVDGKLVFKGSGQEEKWAEELGLEIKSEKATITIETQGLGDVVPLDNVKIKEGKIETQVDKEIELSATPGKVEQVESNFVGWYSNGILVSPDPSFTYSVKGDATLTAVFEMDATLIYYLDENNEEKIKIDKAITLSGYTEDKTITKVEVGKNVLSIAASAFKDCTNLKMTKLPSNLKTIGNKAFYNCKNITITQIPSLCTSIGEEAFAYSGITNITADTINRLTLGNSAFNGCTSLLEAKFYNVKLGTIHGNGSQFAYCNNLTYLQLGKIGIGALDIDASNLLYESKNSKLIVKTYLEDATERVSTNGTNATIYYYDEDGNEVDKYPKE